MRVAPAAVLLLASINATQASELAADYFHADKGSVHVESKNTPSAKVEGNRTKEVIVREVKKTLGEQWVHVALSQAKRESNFNHRAVGIRLGKRHGGQRAVGTFQVLPSTAAGLGFDRRRLLDLEYGVMVGIAYMKECIRSGVTSDQQMNKCFLYGTNGWRGKNGKRKRDKK